MGASQISPVPDIISIFGVCENHGFWLFVILSSISSWSCVAEMVVRKFSVNSVRDARIVNVKEYFPGLTASSSALLAAIKTCLAEKSAKRLHGVLKCWIPSFESMPAQMPSRSSSPGARASATDGKEAVYRLAPRGFEYFSGLGWKNA